MISDGYGRIATREDDEEQVLEKGKVGPKNYILLYEDNEGDRMLVGDVPWEYVRALRSIISGIFLPSIHPCLLDACYELIDLAYTHAGCSLLQ